MIEVQSTYIIKSSGFTAGANKRLHELIYTIFNAVYPERLIALYAGLNLIDADYLTTHSFLEVFIDFQTPGHRYQINMAFANAESSDKKKVLRCQDLEFFAGESRDALIFLQNPI